MIRSRLIILSGCFFSSSLLVIILYFLSGWMSQHPNGFLRKLPSHKIQGLGFTKLQGRYSYLAGDDKNDIYLGNWLKKNCLLKINKWTKDSTLLKVTGFDTFKFTRAGYLKTHSTQLFLFDGNRSLIFSGESRNGKLDKSYNTPYFTAAVPISQNSYILRVVKQGQQNILVKFINNKLMKSYLLKMQGNGIFSTDGMLITSTTPNRIFYVYYYRNQFLSLDTNLKVLYKGKTIDTVAHAHIKVAPINSLNEITMASPPLFVNEQCSANDKWLFIHSALKADNEVNTLTDHAATIDVYSIKDGKYDFSFYLTDFNKEKMQDFIVYGNTLIALYDQYLYFYQLNF